MGREQEVHMQKKINVLSNHINGSISTVTPKLLCIIYIIENKRNMSNAGTFYYALCPQERKFLVWKKDTHKHAQVTEKFNEGSMVLNLN